MGLEELIIRPPGSAVFIFFLTLCMTTFTAFTTTKITDQPKLRRYRREISEWRKMMQTAQKTGDEKLALEVRRRSKIIQNMQKQVSAQSIKPTLIFLIPFLIIFFVLSAFYGRIPVAAIPYNLGALQPIPLFGQLIFAYTSAESPTDPSTWVRTFGDSTYGLTYIGWYLFCSYALQSIINRLFGVSLGGLGAPGAGMSPMQR
jgi:uncharacterized membrane protein (DUF106 family)